MGLVRFSTNEKEHVPKDVPFPTPSTNPDGKWSVPSEHERYKGQGKGSRDQGRKGGFPFNPHANRSRFTVDPLDRTRTHGEVDPPTPGVHAWKERRKKPDGRGTWMERDGRATSGTKNTRARGSSRWDRDARACMRLGARDRSERTEHTQGDHTSIPFPCKHRSCSNTITLCLQAIVFTWQTHRATIEPWLSIPYCEL